MITATIKFPTAKNEINIIDRITKAGFVEGFDFIEIDPAEGFGILAHNIATAALLVKWVRKHFKGSNAARITTVDEIAADPKPVVEAKPAAEPKTATEPKPAGKRAVDMTVYFVTEYKMPNCKKATTYKTLKLTTYHTFIREASEWAITMKFDTKVEWPFGIYSEVIARKDAGAKQLATDTQAN